MAKNSFKGRGFLYRSLHHPALSCSLLAGAIDEFNKRKPRARCRLNEIYVKGKWKYYYRSIDPDGDAIEFLLTEKRDNKTALCYLKKAIGDTLSNPLHAPALTSRARVH